MSYSWPPEVSSALSVGSAWLLFSFWYRSTSLVPIRLKKKKKVRLNPISCQTKESHVKFGEKSDNDGLRSDILKETRVITVNSKWHSGSSCRHPDSGKLKKNWQVCSSGVLYQTAKSIHCLLEDPFFLPCEAARFMFSTSRIHLVRPPVTLWIKLPHNVKW